jgi:flagellar protein FlaI
MEMASHWELLSRYAHGDENLITNFESVKGEILEEYWLLKPYTRAVIVRDEVTQEYVYNLLEPTLSETEFKVLEEIYSALSDLLILKHVSIAIEEKESVLVDAYENIIDEYGIKMSRDLNLKYLYYLFRDFLGLGPIDGLMKDPNIEDIHCDGYEIPIYVYHRRYSNLKTNLIFSAAHLDKYVVSLVQRTGKHISYGNPIIDATLSDGSRLQATLGTEITPKGSSFTIRKFSIDPLTPVDLIAFNTYSPEELAFLWMCVEYKLNMMIVGETASGKTTTMNALLMFLPTDAKVVSIEDTREIQLYHENWIAAITREHIGFEAEEGQITMYDLLKAALRQRPDYIVVGEVRGIEAQVLFQAMATGHACYSTLHAGDVGQVVYRLENEPLDVPRSMIQMLDIVNIQLQWRRKGIRVRRCKEIDEIVGVDPASKDLLVNKLYEWSVSGDSHRQVYTPSKLEKISALSGLTISELIEEIQQRKRLLEYMREKGIRNYIDVTRVVRTYYRNPNLEFEELTAYAIE